MPNVIGRDSSQSQPTGEASRGSIRGSPSKSPGRVAEQAGRGRCHCQPVLTAAMLAAGGCLIRLAGGHQAGDLARLLILLAIQRGDDPRPVG